MRNFILIAGLLFVLPTIATACPVIAEGVRTVELAEGDLIGDEPLGYPVVAGGDIDLSQCGYPGGFVIERPDYSFQILDIDGDLLVSVTSPGCDTVLLVNAPDGEWYFDDDTAGDLQPQLLVDVAPGRLDIWVGTFGAETCEAELTLF
ncbi:hypothetical protein HKCCE4037_15650 [Rhodobacterales bacterium HKCCE4037]|nr:hypothetical protein [Rhodobacterales bacterium HKCCE4037]